MKVIQKFLRNNLRNFNYIVYSESTKEAIFFDPMDIDQTLPIAKELGLKPKYLINTHNHHDHIKDNSKFLKLNDTQKINLKHNEEFYLSPSEKIRCLYTPGHVEDHYCYLIINNNSIVGVISGDTVFNCGVGNCKDGGDPKKLYESIKNEFLLLDESVNIYPSHDYFLNNLQFAKTVEADNAEIDRYIDLRSKQQLDEEFMITTIGEEKLFNPFFRVFEGIKFKDNTSGEFENFKFLRARRDEW